MSKRVFWPAVSTTASGEVPLFMHGAVGWDRLIGIQEGPYD